MQIGRLSDNKLILNLTFALGIAFLLSLLLFFGFFHTWQVALSDVLYNEKSPLEDILIIEIDDKSLQEVGRWPWDRENLMLITYHRCWPCVVGDIRG